MDALDYTEDLDVLFAERIWRDIKDLSAEPQERTPTVHDLEVQ